VSKLKELEKRLRDEPENLGLRIALATAYREVARMNDAIELYRSVAMAYRDQGRVQQAIAVCKSLLEIAPNDSASRALLATLIPPAPASPSSPPSPVREREVDVDIDVGTLVAAPVIPDRPAQPIPQILGRDSSGLRTRRSSLDETPLPRAVPYHVHDPTTSMLSKLSETDLVTGVDRPSVMTDPDPIDAAETRVADDPGTRPSVRGLANAARRISDTLTGHLRASNVDVTSELDTRQRPRIDSAQAERLSRPPPTVPFQRADLDEPDDDAVTPPPGVEHREEDKTQPREMPGVRTRAPTSSVLTTQFFAPLPVERRAQVLQRFQRRAVPNGTPVIRQGETAHPLVLVSKGRLDVRVERADGKIIQVGTVALGEYVGEVALLHRVPAMANVIAAGDVEILALPPRDFYELAGAFPALWAELKDVAERRQREYEYRLRAGR
jgi:hypothetical protein